LEGQGEELAALAKRRAREGVEVTIVPVQFGLWRKGEHA